VSRDVVAGRPGAPRRGGLGAAAARLACTAGAAAACAGSGPDQTLDAYAAALERGDAEAVRRLAGTASTSMDAEALEHVLAENPAMARRAAVRLRGAREVERRATWVTAGGETVELVRREGTWRVHDAPVPPIRFDTPEQALRTFFFAARGHLSLLRQTLPEAHRTRFASDAELGRHLHARAARIAAARDALLPLAPGTACIEGASATIPWGDGREVRLIRQDGTWRVVDLE